MATGLADLLACVAAFARSLEGTFDPQRFLDEFSARTQALVPHDGMLVAWLEDEGRSFSAFARHVVGAGRASSSAASRSRSIRAAAFRGPPAATARCGRASPS